VLGAFVSLLRLGSRRRGLPIPVISVSDAWLGAGEGKLTSLISCCAKAWPMPELQPVITAIGMMLLMQ